MEANVDRPPLCSHVDPVPQEGMKASRQLSYGALLCLVLAPNAVCAFRLTHSSAIRPWEGQRSACLLTLKSRPTGYHCAEQDRRKSDLTPNGMSSMFLRKFAGKAVASTLLVGSLWVGTCASPASAGLLDEFGADGSKIVEVSAASDPVKKGESAIDPTLRACTWDGQRVVLAPARER
jgi:hypothetical protein